MAGPTRVKVYPGTPGQQAASFAADRAAAAVHGWEPLKRELMPDSLRITYHQPVRDEWAPAAAPASGQDQSTVTQPSGVNHTLLVIIAAGAMIAVGSFLPWITASTGFASVSRGGMEGGDGWITLALGAILILGALAGVGGNGGGIGPVGVLLVSVLTLALGYFEYQDVQHRIKANETVGLIQVGIGLWLILAGGGLAFLGSFGLRTARKTTSTSRPDSGRVTSSRAKAPPPTEDTWKA